jgi:hypothetical protein
MGYTKKTLRKKPPLTRELAKRLNAVELELKRLKRMLPKIEVIEVEANAFMRQSKGEGKVKVGVVTQGGERLGPESDLGDLILPEKGGVENGDRS